MAALRRITIPTTYSGAELTPFFGMTDRTYAHQGGWWRLDEAPSPSSTTRCSPSARPRVERRDGMNALTHCVEVVYSPHRSPEAEAIARAGIRRLAPALPAVVDDPDDVESADRCARRRGARRTIARRTRTSVCTTVSRSSLAGCGRRATGSRRGDPAHAMRFNADVAPHESSASAKRSATRTMRPAPSHG